MKVRTSVIRLHLNKVRNGPKGILLTTSLDSVWFLSYFCIGTNTSNSYIWGFNTTVEVICIIVHLVCRSNNGVFIVWGLAPL